jgi:hypothetical protein
VKFIWEIRDYICFDHYADPDYYYGGIKTTDMKEWQDISQTLTFPRGIRHGTVSWVPGSVMQAIQGQ